MGDDALARLRARLPAANDQAMAQALNARAARTASMLNALCARAEFKLGAAARALREAEARTALLERALDAEAAEATTREDDGASAEATEATEATEEAPPEAAEEEAAPEEAAPEEAAPAAPPETNALASDPKYAIYFKMLNMGVPAQAVRNKMSLDGADASVLDQM